jgi:MinD superfamily P-loop ATPase
MNKMDEKRVTRHVTDLGAAAYILMNKYKVVGKKGQAIYFEMNENEVDMFEEVKMEYLSSEFHRFDSCLMSLKKIGESPRFEEK